MTKQRICTNRRELLLGGAAVALVPMQGAAAPSDVPASYAEAYEAEIAASMKTADQRINLFAEWFDLKVPPLERDEDGEIEISEPLMTWCNSNGVSLDWLFLGYPKCMAFAYRATLAAVV